MSNFVISCSPETSTLITLCLTRDTFSITVLLFFAFLITKSFHDIYNFVIQEDKKFHSILDVYIFDHDRHQLGFKLFGGKRFGTAPLVSWVVIVLIALNWRENFINNPVAR